MRAFTAIPIIFFTSHVLANPTRYWNTTDTGSGIPGTHEIEATFQIHAGNLTGSGAIALTLTDWPSSFQVSPPDTPTISIKKPVPPTALANTNIASPPQFTDGNTVTSLMPLVTPPSTDTRPVSTGIEPKTTARSAQNLTLEIDSASVSTGFATSVRESLTASGVASSTPNADRAFAVVCALLGALC